MSFEGWTSELVESARGRPRRRARAARLHAGDTDCLSSRGSASLVCLTQLSVRNEERVLRPDFKASGRKRGRA